MQWSYHNTIIYSTVEPDEKTKIFCLFRDVSIDPFTVYVDENAMVDDLKSAIQIRKKLPDYALTLWKVGSFQSTVILPGYVTTADTISPAQRTGTHRPR